VVKELMENAIDAGATAITVEIRGGGIDYLRVTDNGGGIEPNQVRMAFENHATSKLQSADQLDDIRTLGFRGEALPSIASVSHVEMTTRARGQDTGARLNIDGGADLRVKETGCPEGTTFVMKDLFYNLPVRRAFLKKPAYEGGLVGDVVARMLLGNPNIAVRYINNGTNVYHSFGDGKLRHAIFAVYGKQTAEQMVAVDACEGGTRIYGLIGIGEQAKATRAHQAFFINGRTVRCALLSRALEEVCRSRVTIGMYPMCALNLVVPPTSVNVNVHPNKLEVRFKDEAMMRGVAERLLATAFEGEKGLQIRDFLLSLQRVL
jgi:DNA mismatch repair protein MutL